MCNRSMLNFPLISSLPTFVGNLKVSSQHPPSRFAVMTCTHVVRWWSNLLSPLVLDHLIVDTCIDVHCRPFTTEEYIRYHCFLCTTCSVQLRVGTLAGTGTWSMRPQMNPGRHKTNHNAQCHHINSVYPLPLPLPHFSSFYASRLQWLTAVAKKQRQIFYGKGPCINTNGPTSNVHTQDNCCLLYWGFVGPMDRFFSIILCFKAQSIFTPAGDGSTHPTIKSKSVPIA